MTDIVVHRNLKLLKHKLRDVEAKSGKRVGYAVKIFPFSELIPILTREHLEEYRRRQTGQPLSHEDPDTYFTSAIDTLVVREEDQFAYLKNDESEDESTLTKNLRKIKSDPPKPKPESKPEPKLKPEPKPEVRPPPRPASTDAPPQKESKPKEVVAEDLENLMKDNNWHIICVELNRRIAAFKSDKLARSVLRKSVTTLLDLDDTFQLINFIKIVFEFEYLEDWEFWDELLGKLKRKISPHVRDHRYKCRADPMVVVNNYNIIIKEIYNHFTYSGVMRHARIPFYLAQYLTLLCTERKELVASVPQPAIANNPTALIQPMQAIDDATRAPLTTDAEKTFDVDILKTANGKSVFKIRSSRRNVEFNPKLFG